MPSQKEKRAERKAARLAELNAGRDREGSSESVVDVKRIPPLQRGPDHLAPLRPDKKQKAEDVQPDLTNVSLAALEAELQPKDAEAGARVIHPARIAPDAERPRTPLQRSPAAGPGTWPVPEDQLPAVLPADPPDRERPGSKTFADVAGVKVKRGGEIDVRSTKAGSTTITVPKRQVSAAAALWLKLRTQFPNFTQEQLQDEFHLQLESMLGTVSPHGQTAAGEERIEVDKAGAAQQKAIDDLVENNSEGTLREMAAKLGLVPAVVKADHDKAEIARAIIITGGPPPKEEAPAT